MLRPTKIRHYLRAMQTRGIPAPALLAGTGVDASRLDDPSYLVSAEQCHAVVANMIQLTGNGGIGFDVGAGTQLTELGILGYALASSKTLGQTIHLWAKYGSALVGLPFSLQMIDGAAPGEWGMQLPKRPMGGAVFRFYLEETLAGGILSFGPLLTGRPLKIREMAFAFSAPSYAARYEALFHCPVQFDAPQTRILVAAPSLDTPVTSNDDDLRELCIHQCGLLAQQLGRQGAVSARLMSALRAHGNIPALDEAARGLSMSPRTLRRQLQREGTSYQKVLDEFRCELAKEYLGAGMMQPKEIGYLLGFAQVNAFRRAFKAWTGQTVGDYQASRRPAAPPTAAQQDSILVA